MYIAQKYLTFNHRLKIQPAQSNLILQRVLPQNTNKNNYFKSSYLILLHSAGKKQFTVTTLSQLSTVNCQL